MRFPALAIIAVVLAAQASAQNAAAALAFDVASVRTYSQQEGGATGVSGGPGTSDPERYTGRGMPLHYYLCVAFDHATPDCQQRITGPNWIDTEKYDITANVPPGASKQQFQTMLQNLLVERFKLAVHRETRTQSVYELVIAKNGSKLKQSPDAAAEPLQLSAPPDHDADGFAVIPAGRSGLIRSFRGGLGRWTARQQTISDVARELSLPGNGAGRPVIDKTGLTGKYDFTLVYDVRRAGAPVTNQTPMPILEDALEQQLGLKLVDAKAVFDFVIVDQGEKVPTDN